ncbi:hypothetical protein [Cupriavidus sp. TA19]|uniref:hypothetical protein n=1 Tax=Cupriavidus sp. TA19 TaxID=701108 RepID=UPI00295E4578|nr:hypothetical protein [Cupriavidus sp. TA19]
MGIIESVRQYDLNIPAGGAQNIDVAGDRVHFLSAIDPFAQIEIRPNYAQGNITLKPGQGFKFSEQVTRWVVFNRGTVDLSGYLMIGSGDFFDQRITGDVNVIDNGKARTLSGQSFAGYTSDTAAAGNRSGLQLWNPAGSGKDLAVKTIYVGVGTSTAYSVAFNTTAFATLASPPQCKMRGGPATVAQLRREQFAGYPARDTSMLGGSIQAGNPVPLILDDPIYMKPGTGLSVVFDALAIFSSMAVEFVEV